MIMWENDNKHKDTIYYSAMRLVDSNRGMDALRAAFPSGRADSMTTVLFSTSGVHGTYNTIEEAEQHLIAPTEETHGEITFLIINPRRVTLWYGCCTPTSIDDIEFLKLLRSSSHAELAMIGT